MSASAIGPPIEINSRSSIGIFLQSIAARTRFETFNEEASVADAVMERRAANTRKQSERAGLLSHSLRNAELALVAPHGTARELVAHHRSAANK